MKRKKLVKAPSPKIKIVDKLADIKIVPNETLIENKKLKERVKLLEKRIQEVQVSRDAAQQNLNAPKPFYKS